jgi:hypothetical protein
MLTKAREASAEATYNAAISELKVREEKKAGAISPFGQTPFMNMISQAQYGGAGVTTPNED